MRRIFLFFMPREIDEGQEKKISFMVKLSLVLFPLYFIYIPVNIWTGDYAFIFVLAGGAVLNIMELYMLRSGYLKTASFLIQFIFIFIITSSEFISVNPDSGVNTLYRGTFSFVLVFFAGMLLIQKSWQLWSYILFIFIVTMSIYVFKVLPFYNNEFDSFQLAVLVNIIVHYLLMGFFGYKIFSINDELYTEMKYRYDLERRHVKVVEARVQEKTEELQKSNENLAWEMNRKEETARALAASEKKYRRLTENISDVVWSMGFDLMTDYVSPSIERLTGFTAEEHMSMSIEDKLTPESVGVVREKFLEIHRKTESEPVNTDWTEVIELEYRKKNGGTIWTEVNVSFIIGRDGRPEGFQGVSRDITERKKNEQILTEAVQKSEAAARAKSHFIASMSHEIRTPLNAVIGMSELALHENDDALKDEYLMIVKDSAGYLLDVLNDILDFSKIESGNIEREEVNFSLEEMLEQVRNIFSHDIRQKGLGFSIHLDPATPKYLFGDSSKLKQIIVNFVSNALKFTVEGEVSVKAEMASAPEGGPFLVEISVSDTGIGISEDRLDNVFVPFHQAELSTTRQYGGTGLGLSISRELAEIMEGRIWVESEQGTGSTFFIEVPLQRGRALDETEKTQFYDGDISGKHVLIVEDNRINARLVSVMLEKDGAKGTVVHNGGEALKALMKDTYDCVLMDIEMPGENGFIITGRIKNGEGGEENRDIPIIALTAHVITEIRNKCKDAGMEGFIPKPVRTEMLRSEIARILKK